MFLKFWTFLGIMSAGEFVFYRSRLCQIICRITTLNSFLENCQEVLQVYLKELHHRSFSGKFPIIWSYFRKTKEPLLKFSQYKCCYQGLSWCRDAMVRFSNGRSKIKHNKIRSAFLMHDFTWNVTWLWNLIVIKFKKYDRF